MMLVSLLKWSLQKKKEHIILPGVMIMRMGFVSMSAVIQKKGVLLARWSISINRSTKAIQKSDSYLSLFCTRDPGLEPGHSHYCESRYYIGTCLPIPPPLTSDNILLNKNIG